MTKDSPKQFPSLSELRSYIDCYWIEKSAQSLFQQKTIYAYPGITPEIIIPISGYFQIVYKGRHFKLNKALLFSHLEETIEMNTTHLQSFIIITFKSRSVSSILPFLSVSAVELIKNPICELSTLFNPSYNQICDRFENKSNQQIALELDEFFFKNLEGSSNGFLLEIMENSSRYTDLKEIMATTKYSYSTIERYYKKETGLTPKKYQSLFRYKKAVEEIYETKNTDWLHYVEQYGYYDQSHFIKEIKRYTHFTPLELIQTPGFLSYRP